MTWRRYAVFGVLSLALGAVLWRVAGAEAHSAADPGSSADDPGGESSVESLILSIDRTEIAAGGVESPPHQTPFTISVTPSQVAEVTVSMTGGDGAAFLIIPRRRARARFSTGETLLPGGSVKLPTNTDGRISGVLTSSNKSTETCALRAECPAGAELLHDRQEVTFVFGEQTVDIPDILVPDEGITAKATRSLGGEPLGGHTQLFYVSGVVVDGRRKTALLPSADMDRYVTFDVSPPVCATDESGKASLTFRVGSRENVSRVVLTTRDITVYDPTAFTKELKNLFR